ncbi:MAG: hypothetical protein IKA87_04395, partial [Lentisphaeria bacterium]|nr:hypothetical protein [Lentisphaeria bacterium]
MNECAAPCSQEPIKKNSNILPKIILLTAVLLLLLAGVITKLLFAPWQEIAPVQLQPADFLVQHRVISKVMKEFYRKKGPRKEAVLKHSVPEANSILRIAGNIKYKKSPYPLRYYRPEFKENGELSLTFPLRTPVS